MRWALIGCCLLKVLDSGAAGEWWSVAGFLACIPAIWLWSTAGALALAAVVAVLSFDNSHEFFLLSVALVVGLFPERRQMALLLRVQVTVVWVVAGFAKLNPRFRAGQVFDLDQVLLFSALPARVVIWATIAAELVVLPLLLWTRPRLARWAAVGFQGSVTVAMMPLMNERWALLVFNVLIVAAVFAATASPSPSPRTPATTVPTPAW